MTDAEFAEELAERLNLFLKADEARASATLTTALTHAGYANVGHFLRQLCLPRGIDYNTPPEALQNVKFLMPVLADNTRIIGFRAVTGAELQEKLAQMQQRAQETSEKDPEIH